MGHPDGWILVKDDGELVQGNWHPGCFAEFLESLSPLDRARLDRATRASVRQRYREPAQLRVDVTSTAGDLGDTVLS